MEKRIKTYNQLLLQPRRKLGDNHTSLLPTRHIRLPPPQKHLSRLHQIRHAHPIYLIPRLLHSTRPLIEARDSLQIIPQLSLLLVRNGLEPIDVEARYKGGPLGVGIEAQAKEHGLDAGEAAAEIVGGGEGEAEDEVAVVVLSALLGELGGGGGVGGEGEVFLEEGFHVGGGFVGRFVAERAGFKFREDWRRGVSRYVVTPEFLSFWTERQEAYTHLLADQWPISRIPQG